MREAPGSEGIELRDRAATAFVSTLLATLTMVFFSLAFSLSRLTRPLVYKYLLSNAGLTTAVALAVVAGAAGFVLGSKKMTEVFSLVWFTHPVWKGERAWWVLGGLLALVAALALFVR